MVLVLAEKSSVGVAYSKVLGASERKEGYFEGNGFIVTWCVGHLVELANADVYDERYKRWNIADLPFIPDKWQYVVSQSKIKQFNIVKSLMNDNRVSEIILGTDAGREGELIARLVYEKAGCTKPCKRLWVSSMEESALKSAFDNLKDGREYDNLYHSALCRSKADWVIGINSTRIFSKLYNKKLNIGRVQTPTLAMLFERDNSIKNFTKEKYFHARLGNKDSDFEAVSERINDNAEAEKIKLNCNYSQAVVTSVTREKKSISPPKLYDLTTLQREANRLYGFTAQQTLDYAQSLYESRLISYPRTDSKYLTDDMADTVKQLLAIIPQVISQFEGCVSDYEISSVIDSRKVSDHHGLVPTIELANTDINSISSGEQKILLLIANRLLCAVSDNYIYESVTAKIDCNGHIFTERGKSVISEGWRKLRVKSEELRVEDGKEQLLTLPLTLIEGQIISNIECDITEHFTKPPAHFTDGTLLQAMEHAKVDISAEDEETEIPNPSFLTPNSCGLGTPATRAGIIEKLIKTGFAERDGKKLCVTNAGRELVEIVPDVLKSASFTAEWEDSLARISQGEMTADEFMAGVAELTESIISTAKDTVKSELVNRGNGDIIGKCTRCGGDVLDTPKAFSCVCGFAIWKANKFFENARVPLTKEIVSALLSDGKIEVKGLYSQKKNKTYNATVCLDDTGEKWVNFRLEFPKKSKRGV
ncbi:MAG: DNA topoisomerase 3 [Oscillospiraceae bacterium]|nr:DNA topoisomerase 3 [Oscillospiraceae bacterium]